jgi:uncharacterized repeat protein (TIGR01451 family)
MKLFVARMRAVEKRRGVIVVGVFLLVALSAGATSVLANGGLSSPRGRGDIPVPRAPLSATKHSRSIIVGHSVKNDVSRPLRSMPKKPFLGGGFEREASPNPRPVSRHKDAPDAARQTKAFAPNMPATTLNFDGILFPGVGCNCAPPDTNGEVGATQYVQMVNAGFQVFDKATGNSLLGPVDINTVWTGFGGVCAGDSAGDPIVVYDQLANRWLISQFAGPAGGALTDECIAVSTGVDATGTWYRYDFHLGTDFFDYPKIGVWPDAYYMSMNVFNAAGTAYLGPQPFAFNRAAMLVGNPATFITTRNPSVFNAFNDGLLPADLDGSTPPPAGAPEPFLMSGTGADWPLWRFHVNFSSPGTSTFTVGGTLTPAAYTLLCPSTRNCVPQQGTASGLDGVADRPMFRLAYRNFGDHEALVGNQTVDSSGVAGIRWFEIGNATSGAPTFTQQSTYQPDTTWRWMGSAAMDRQENLAIGFSASDAATFPEIRYAGRLASDPDNTLAQGEATLLAGTGSQRLTGNRWGDYSDLTVDPVDGCTFWYTNEYYSAPNAQFDWRTRVGNFRFPSCAAAGGASLSILNTADAKRVIPGAQIGFNVTLLNSGSDPATGIVLTDSLPGGAGLNWSVDAAHSNAGWAVSGSPPNEVLVGPGTVNGTTASHVHVVSTTPAGSCATFGNTATFTSTNGGNGSASATTGSSCSSVTVTRAGTGSGTVTSAPAGISCGVACAATFGDGTPITLTATAATGSTFTGWSGAGCAGAGLCTFVLNGAKAITATFTLQTRHLTVGKKGNGRGTVTSSPVGIGCGVTCNASFSYGTAVTLTAKPTATSVFSGWSGACIGKAPCPLSMTVDRAATATFRAKCVVPKLLGLTLKKAKARITRAHCRVGRVTKKRSSARKKGKVLAQKPKPGKRLAPGARVNLTVGRGWPAPSRR